LGSGGGGGGGGGDGDESIRAGCAVVGVKIGGVKTGESGCAAAAALTAASVSAAFAAALAAASVSATSVSENVEATGCNRGGGGGGGVLCGGGGGGGGWGGGDGTGRSSLSVPTLPSVERVCPRRETRHVLRSSTCEAGIWVSPGKVVYTYRVNPSATAPPAAATAARVNPRNR